MAVDIWLTIVAYWLYGKKYVYYHHFMTTVFENVDEVIVIVIFQPYPH